MADVRQVKLGDYQQTPVTIYQNPNGNWLLGITIPNESDATMIADSIASAIAALSLDVNVVNASLAVNVANTPLAVNVANTPLAVSVAIAAAPSSYDLTLLASQARATAAAQASADQINLVGTRGAMIFLNVTGAAGALKTLTLDVQVKDPISGNYIVIANTGAIGTTVTAAGLYLLMVYPGASNLLAGLFAGNAALPKTWRARVTANDATSWTYSLGASLLQ
jgi:hypothetical protein